MRSILIVIVSFLSVRAQQTNVRSDDNQNNGNFNPFSDGLAESAVKESDTKILDLIKERYVKGYNIWKVKQFNAKVALNKYRRSYWLGDRYYELDADAQIPSRFRCTYNLNEQQQEGLFYESDNQPISEVLFQCRVRFDTCCGLNCCATDAAMQKAPGCFFGQPCSSTNMLTQSTAFVLFVMVAQLVRAFV